MRSLCTQIITELNDLLVRLSIWSRRLNLSSGQVNCFLVDTCKTKYKKEQLKFKRKKERTLRKKRLSLLRLRSRSSLELCCSSKSFHWMANGCKMDPNRKTNNEVENSKIIENRTTHRQMSKRSKNEPTIRFLRIFVELFPGILTWAFNWYSIRSWTTQIRTINNEMISLFKTIKTRENTRKYLPFLVFNWRGNILR
jgi:hypothetical protein